MFAYGPADATAIPEPHNLLPHVNPDLFCLSGTGLPRLSWTAVCLLVAVILAKPALVVDVLRLVCYLHQ